MLGVPGLYYLEDDCRDILISGVVAYTISSRQALINKKWAAPLFFGVYLSIVSTSLARIQSLRTERTRKP